MFSTEYVQKNDAAVKDSFIIVAEEITDCQSVFQKEHFWSSWMSARHFRLCFYSQLFIIKL